MKQSIETNILLLITISIIVEGKLIIQSPQSLKDLF